MSRIELKRGTTTVKVPEKDVAHYEALGYKKATAATPKTGRKTATPASDK